MKAIFGVTFAAVVLFLVFLTANAQVTFPNRGGTGTSTIPSYGMVLVGNGLGTYSPVATSSLGISAGASFSTTSANYWETQQTSRSADDLTNNSLKDLADVSSMTEAFGNLLSWTGSTWSNVATSTLGLPTFGNLASYLTLSDWFATTTDALDEGSSNRYYADGRVQTYLDTLSKGYFFSTTSAAHFLSLNDSSFSTTSADYWKTVRDFFSTTSTNYWLTQKTTTNLAEGSNLYFTDARARSAISETITGIDYASGVFSLTSGYGIPTTAKQTEWDTAYTNRITSLTTTGSSGAATLIGNVLNIPQYAGTTYTATYPVTLTGNAFGLAFGTTSSNTWGGTQTFTNTITGSISGNAGTATSLAANGSNASAGNAILGVDASGNAEGAFDVWTEAENTAAAYTPGSRTLTVAGTANQITSSAGAQDLSANRTWTLSLPNHVIFPGNFQATNATTTNATTTALDVLTRLTFGGVTGTAWSAFCTSITGSADLCDGSDAAGAGGSSAYEIATTSTISVPQLAYFTQTSGRTTLGGVSTTTLSGDSQVAVSNSPVVIGGSAAVLSIVADSIGDTQLAFNTGQNLTTASSPTFAGATIGTLTGLIKGASGVLSAATAGTDYVAGGTGAANQFSYFTGSGAIAGDADFTLDAAAGRATFTYASTTGISTSYASSTSAFFGTLGLTNALTVANGGTGATTLTGVLKGNGTGAFTAAVDGTDFTLTDAITCTNQAITAVTAAGVSTCSSINNAFWSGTDLSVANGGTGLSTFGGTNAVLFTTAADTLTSDASNFVYNTTIDALGLGTTTPRWALTIASSTAPQLTLTDASPTSAPFNFRSISNSFYISTSSPTTFATSSAFIFLLNGQTGSTTAAKLRVSGLVNCNTIDTNSSGDFVCGTDEGGGGGGTPGGSGSELQYRTGASTFGGIPNSAVDSLGDVGIGSTTPWALFAIASSTWGDVAADYARPLFAVATSSGHEGSLLRVSATSTSLARRSLTSAINYFQNGVRIFFGTPTFWGTTEARDHFVFNGRINVQNTALFECNAASHSVALTADANGACGDWAYQEDGTGVTTASVETAGSVYFGVSVAAASTNSGSGMFVGGIALFTAGTSTPVMETMIGRPSNFSQATTTYVVGLSNTNPSGTTFETEPTAGCFFIASSTTPNWRAVCKRSNSLATYLETSISTTTAFGSPYPAVLFRIEMDENESRFYTASSSGPLTLLGKVSGSNYPNDLTLSAGAFVSRGASGGTSAGTLNIGMIKLWVSRMLQ